MKIKTPYTWILARAGKFNQDTVRRRATPYRPSKLACFINKQNETAVDEIKEWIHDNDIRQYAMFGVFIDHPDRVYYHGLSFEFKNENDLIFFKMRFF